MPKLTALQRKFILDNADKLSSRAMALKLGLREKAVVKFLDRRSRKKDSPNPSPAAKTFTVTRLDILSILGLIVLGFAIYGQTLHFHFVFDDAAFVKNPILHDFSRIDAIWKRWPTRFLNYLSFPLNFQLSRFDPSSYHLFNMAAHIFTAILVLLWAKQTQLALQIQNQTPTPTSPAPDYPSWIPAVAALLFLAHPVQTQAVTLVSQRVAVLAAFGTIACMLFYAWARIRGQSLWLVPAFFACLAAMFTKENAYLIPFALLLYSVCFLDRTRQGIKKTALTLIPFAGAWLIVFFTAYYPKAAMNTGLAAMTRETALFSRTEYLLTQLNVVRTYWRLIFAPLGLNLDHDYPVTKNLFEIKTLLSLSLHLSLITWALSSLKRNPVLCFGIGWFYLMLSVESSVIPIEDVIYEHRLYLPLAGISLAIPFLLWKRVNNQHVYLAGIITLLVLMSLGAYKRNAVWKDSFSLWSDAVSKSPVKARPHLNLGIAFMDKGNLDMAIEEFQKTIALKPDTETLGALAAAYADKKNYDKAIEYLQKAISSNPESGKFHNNLGLVYEEIGKPDLALQEFRNAIEKDPADADFHNNLGTLLTDINPQEAEKELRRALDIDPNHKALLNLGALYYESGKFSAAKILWTKLLEIYPRHPKARHIRELLAKTPPE